MRWFKFYGQDWLTDLKIMSMSIEDRLCFITLLCLASSGDNDGTIKSCNEDAIIKLTQLNDDPNNKDNEVSRARGCLERYKALQTVTIACNGDVTVVNFSRRQAENLSNAERQKKYRESKKTLVNKVKKGVTQRNDRNVTQHNDRNARIEENRIDKNIHTSETSSPFIWEEYLQKMHSDPKIHIQLIAYFLERRGLQFSSEKEIKAVIKRHLRSAVEVSAFEKKKVFKAMEECDDLEKKKGIKWTLETVLKMVTK